MKELGVHDRSSFPLPELSMQDTYRKTRTRKRAMGDSRKMDGRIFGNVTKGSTLRKVKDLRNDKRQSLLGHR